MTTIRRSTYDGNLVSDKADEDASVRKVVNPYVSSTYYKDSSSSALKEANPSVEVASGIKSGNLGWNSADTISTATVAEDPTKIPKPVSAAETLILSDEPVKAKEIIALLDTAYKQVSSKDSTAIEAIVENVQPGPDLLKRRMDALSKKIDEALQAETRDYEVIHAMMLRFCMIHMRTVAKDDQEYIAKIGEQIKIQSGKIRDTYNTWPVVVITLVSSAVSVGGGVAGFSTFIRPGSELAKTFAQNAQQFSTMSTGIQSAGQLVSSGQERDRQVLQLVLKRDQDKEEEKKGAKHGTKESQKLFRTAIEEFFRNIRETISSILRG